MYHRRQITKAEQLTIKIGKLIDQVRNNTFDKINANNSQKLWKTIKKATASSNHSNGNLLDSLKIDYNQLNSYFVDVATDADYDPIETANMVQTASGRCNQDTVDNLTDYDIFSLLKSIKKTSSGPDEIPYWVFRECAIELTPVVNHIVNLSIGQGVVPSAWKKAYVTPVPKFTKTTDFKDYSGIRPISVTPILCRMVEKIIVRKYLWPKLDDPQMQDQFAFRPSGSTTAALVYILHHVHTMFENGNEYVRCLLIDYSKAFDTVNHKILLTELEKIGLRQSIFKWIADFLANRTQAVKVNGIITGFLPITRSIVQGSGLGPYLYITLARTLKTKSACNIMPKYADDTTLLVPQNSDCTLEDEFENVKKWSHDNKLTINKSKTKEIIFWKNGRVNNKCTIPLIPCIERVDQTKLLGVILTTRLSWSAHIDCLIKQITQRFYLLNQLKRMSLGIKGLTTVFRALVVSRILYALPSYSGFLLQSDKDRIDALFRKATRWGIADNLDDFESLSLGADHNLFRKMNAPSHCLYQLLPEHKTYKIYNIRPNTKKKFKVPLIRHSGLKNSFIYKMIA